MIIGSAVRHRLLHAGENASVGRPAGECLFVGDNIEADVVAAHTAGLPALLVWTGGSTPADLEASGGAVGGG